MSECHDRRDQDSVYFEYECAQEIFTVSYKRNVYVLNCSNVYVLKCPNFIKVSLKQIQFVLVFADDSIGVLCNYD